MTKTALCIGINDYPGTHMDLAGCVNDANAWASVLTERGFSVVKLLDDQATKASMVAAFQNIIGAAKGGDLVVITYSGHGTYVPDTSGDELDKFDEALCPHDIQTGGGPLIDDEIHTLFAARAPGVQLVLIADSCHSGTVTRNVAPEDPLPNGLRARFMPMGNWMPERQLPRDANGVVIAEISNALGTSPFAPAHAHQIGDLLLAGCQEGPDNVSYDATIDAKPVGAFSYHALKALKDLPPKATYADWMVAITPGSLPTLSYPQTPQIVGTAAARKHRIFS